VTERMPVPRTVGETLADLLDELQDRVHREISDLNQDDLYWRPDPGGNSCGATVWHFTRWLDVISVRLLDGLTSDQEIWFAEGWARRTAYDPRGLGEGGLGVLTGYSIEEVLKIPRQSSALLLEYLEQVASRLQPQLLACNLSALYSDAPGVAVMDARAAVTGRKNTYGWIRLIILGSFQHLGEVAAIVATRRRLQSSGRHSSLR